MSRIQDTCPVFESPVLITEQQMVLMIQSLPRIILYHDDIAEVKKMRCWSALTMRHSEPMTKPIETTLDLGLALVEFGYTVNFKKRVQA